jgi:hypothetical protein
MGPIVFHGADLHAPQVAQAFVLGDVSFQGGRTYHGAPNLSQEDRVAVSVFYVACDMPGMCSADADNMLCDRA